MRLGRIRPTAWRVTLHPLELAAVMSTLRWVTEGAEGALPTDAIDRLRNCSAAARSISSRRAPKGRRSPCRSG